jgi:hypothetical protein
MREKIQIILQYAKNTSLLVILPVFLYISNSFNLFDSGWLVQSIYYLFVGCCIAGFGVFAYRNSEVKSLFLSSMVANGIVYMIAYSTLRSIIGTAQIESYFINKYNLSNSTLHFFKTIFSIGYGIFQFLSGYLIGKFGNKVIGLLGIMSSICILLTNSNYISSIEVLMLVRFINGISVSCGALCIAYQLRLLKVSTSKYSAIFSASNMFASTLNAVAMNQLSRHLEPYIALDMISYMFLIPSLVFLVSGFIYNKSNQISNSESNVNQISDSKFNSVNNHEVSKVKYLDVIKNAVLNSKYNLMFLQSILMVIAGWTLRDSCLSSICQICSVENAVALRDTAKYLLEIGFIFGFLFILFFLKGENYRKMMIVFAFMNFCSSIVLLTHNYITMHIYVIYLCVFIIGMSVKGHLIPQIMAGSSEKDNRLSAGLVGFFNAGVMLFALPFCQQIMPTFSLEISTLIFSVISGMCVFISILDSSRQRLT